MFRNIIIPDVYRCKDISDYIDEYYSFGGMQTLINIQIGNYDNTLLHKSEY